MALVNKKIVSRSPHREAPKTSYYASKTSETRAWANPTNVSAKYKLCSLLTSALNDDLVHT